MTNTPDQNILWNINEYGSVWRSLFIFCAISLGGSGCFVIVSTIGDRDRKMYSELLIPREITSFFMRYFRRESWILCVESKKLLPIRSKIMRVITQFSNLQRGSVCRKLESTLQLNLPRLYSSTLPVAFGVSNENSEQLQDYFRTLGIEVSRFRNLPIHYYPCFTLHGFEEVFTH